MGMFYECDRCGSIIRDANAYHVMLSVYKNNSLLDVVKNKDIDLCESCYRELMEFFGKEAVSDGDAL